MLPQRILIASLASLANCRQSCICFV